ncbi:MAG: hypothetical protein Q8Q35_04470, partial [Nanoarchaeota archaeon]|nr:hypothetical protein [Nanoarchaeota archaeon]
SVFCWDKGLIVQKKVQELKKGDYLISFRKAEEIKRKIKDIKFEYKYNRKNVIKKIRITKEFVRLIGYYLSEGHSTTSINQVGFSFNINEKEYIEDCKKIIKEIFPNVNILDRHPNPNSHQIVIHSKEIYSLIRHLCKDKKEKKVPNFSWTLPRDYFLELLKGYARGDAHKKGEYHITIKSVALQMTTQFVWLCKLNNISCNLGFEKNKLHKLPQGNEFKGSYVHCIYIPKSEIYIDEFYRERNKFSPYPGDKLLPVDGLVEVYRQCKPGNFLSHRKEQMTLRKDRANLTRINNVINWIEDYKKEPLNLRSKTILEAYKKAIKGEITTIRIEEISFFKKGIVYDISVEDTERFFGNYYPLLLHNSGNKGFHIAIPFESFPDEVNGIVTKNLFPDALRVMAAYLQDMIHEMLVQKLMEKESVQSLCEKLGKKTEEVMKDGKFDPFTIIDIDTVLISNRHLFRSPYSMHEKSGLVSVPIDINRIMEFDKKEAEPENVKIYRPFLERNKGDTDAKGLIIQAFDWWGKNHAIQGSKGLIDDEIIKTFHELPKQAIAENYFPRCIEKILEGNMEDGKKRAIFILINFFKQMGWRFEDISERIKAWNKKNKQPLSESYIIGQLNWHRRQKENILPPNCSNDSYYRDLQIACEPHICDKNKNPVNCAKRAHRRAKEEEKKEAERLKKKTKKKAKQ